MKQVVMSMSERVPSAKQVGDERRPKSASLHLPSTHHRDFEIHDDIDIVKPGPLSLVKIATTALTCMTLLSQIFLAD